MRFITKGIRGQNPAKYADNPKKKSPATSVPIFSFQGKVGINVSTPSEALTVEGNIQLTGNILKPSDKRIKKNIQPVDSKTQLEHIKKIEIVDYEFADNWNLRGEKERGGN